MTAIPSFSEKLIAVEFDLANGNFEGGGNKARVSGLRISCNVALVGGPDQGQCELAIYGMPLSMMNQLSNVGAVYLKSYLNGITVFAGDETSMSVVFTGVISTGYIDAQDQPNTCFRVLASTGSYYRVVPGEAPFVSITGPLDVASVMQNLAGQMGFGFENNGVNLKLPSSYYYGSAWEIADQVARSAGISWIIDRNMLAISPPGMPRSGEPVTVSPKTGMVGYPAFNQMQLLVSALYNPAIKYGGRVNVESSLLPANGIWTIGALALDLESLTPGGAWFMHLSCYQQGPTIS